MRKFGSLALGLAMAVVAAAGLTVVHPPERSRFRKVSAGKPKRALREPNGQSWRSLKRAVNAGWTPPEPTRKAMERHAWFQKKLHWARMRIALGQELPGDRALVGA